MDEMQRLRDEVANVLADALAARQTAASETERLQAAHDAEVSALHEEADRVKAETHAESERVDLAHAVELATQQSNFDAALASRDLIGQAKGVIMNTMHCDAEEAFALLRDQSQAQNRKVLEIAAEIASRASRGVAPR
jgi:AmiR/NasT family two-component response regulator